MLEQAQQAYESAKLAKSSLGPHASRLNWWEIRAAKHGILTYPLDLAKVKLLGTMLHAAGYRSAGLYFSAAKKEHIRRGGVWDQGLAMEAADANRAFDSGKGPNKKSGYIDLDMAIRAGGYETEWPPSEYGPLLPFHTLAVSTFWLLREIEISTAQLGAVTFEEAAGCGIADFDLPVSKGDVHALGKVRSHLCCCSTTSSCPVWALRQLYTEALSRAGGYGNPYWREAPLCPTPRCDFPTKQGW
jgi:hypothetical protein